MKLIEITKVWDGAKKCEQCSIRELVLFADLNREDFDLLHLPIDDIELQNGGVLYEANQPAKYVYTIRSGLVKLVHHLSDGNYRIVRLLHQGDLAGIEALSGADYLHQAVALQGTSICRIPISNVENLNDSSHHLYKQLTARWQKVQHDADVWLVELTIGNAKKRVASLLLYLSNYHDKGVFYLPTREDIGGLLAITTETASRTVAEFKRLGLLTTHKNTASINKEALLELTK